MVEKKSNRAPEKFIRMLKKAMDAHPEALSLNQVARRADISPAYLSLMLNGRRDIPSNEAISQLERVLEIPEGELFKAAERPTDQALEFFRKDEAGPILRTLAQAPDEKLPAILKAIQRALKGRM